MRESDTVLTLKVRHMCGHAWAVCKCLDECIDMYMCIGTCVCVSMCGHVWYMWVHIYVVCACASDEDRYDKPLPFGLVSC